MKLRRLRPPSRARAARDDGGTKQRAAHARHHPLEDYILSHRRSLLRARIPIIRQERWHSLLYCTLSASPQRSEINGRTAPQVRLGQAHLSAWYMETSLCGKIESSFFVSGFLNSQRERLQSHPTTACILWLLLQQPVGQRRGWL